MLCQKIEYPKGRTFGECVIEEVFSIQMIEGTFVTTICIKDKPKPMSREQAFIYYTKKLRRIWRELGNIS